MCSGKVLQIFTASGKKSTYKSQVWLATTETYDGVLS